MARLPLPRLQEPGHLAVDSRAVESPVPDPGQVEDALAQDAQVFQLLDHACQHRFGQTVHLPEQAGPGTEQGQAALPPSEVRHRRRQPGGHQRRGLPQAPPFSAVRVGQAFLQAGLLELVQAVEVGGALAEVGPFLHPVGGRHVHEHLDGGAGRQTAEEALQDDAHLLDGGVGGGADVAGLDLPDAAQGGVPGIAGLLEQDDAVFGVADHRAVRQQRGERPLVFAHQFQMPVCRGFAHVTAPAPAAARWAPWPAVSTGVSAAPGNP